MGNNEFKATEDLNAQSYLYVRINQANFPVLCANVLLAADKTYFLPKVQPYIIKNLNGMKIGIIGITTDRIIEYQQVEGFNVKDLLGTAEKLFPKVATESDCVLALTHIGYSKDRRLAKRIPKLAATPLPYLRNHP